MTIRSVLLTGLFAMTVPGSAAAQQGLPAEVVKYADLIVTNAVIYAGDDQFSKREAMAVRDGRILAMGTSAEISRMAGPNTRRLDLQGRTHSIIPGLFESHGHGPMGTGGGVENNPDAVQGHLPFPSIKEGVAALGKFLSDNKVPAGRWVVLSGPRDAQYLQKVTRWELDTVSPNNPVVITYGGELSAVNSKAWDAAGLTEATPGAVKNAEGKGTGQLRTWAHGKLSYAIPWAPLTDKDIENQKRTFLEMNAEGITSNVGRIMGRQLTVMGRMWELDALTMRLFVSPGFLRSNSEPEEYLKRIGKLVNFGLGDMVTIIGLTTQHPDGTSGSGAMLTHQRKLRQLEGDPYGPTGENRWMVEGNDALNIQMAIKYGWNVTGVHNQGDLASHLYLQAIDAGNQQKVLAPTSRPHGNDHNTLNTQENFALMKKNNVALSVGLYLGEEPIIYQYGADTANRTSQFKSMIEAGLRPASEEARPALSAIEQMVTRKDEKGRVWGAREALSKQQALWARSLWGAEYAGEGKNLGSLEVGKFGDFVVLGADYMAVPSEEIAEVPVLMTFLGGKVVYDRERDGEIKAERRRGGPGE